MSKNTFFNNVYALVATIPKGKVMTYGQISSLLESRYSGMFVGFAMSAAPEGRGLPCHRVVNRKGEMAPGLIFGGQDEQRKLLRKEGVHFLPDGRIDMKKSLWHNAQAPDAFAEQEEGGGCAGGGREEDDEGWDD